MRAMLLMSALLVTYCHRAHAQELPTRHGLWMDVGLGHGSLHVSSDTLRSRSQDGIDFIWDFGWTFSSRLRAGIGVDQWTSKWGAGKQNWVTSFNILAYYYPLAHRTFYLQAGAASADYMVVHVPTGGERADSTYFSGTAWGITTAVGWDIPVHGSLSLRPLLSYSYGPPRRELSASDRRDRGGYAQCLECDTRRATNRERRAATHRGRLHDDAVETGGERRHQPAR